MFSSWTEHWHLRLANETAVTFITVFVPSLFTKLLFRVFSSVKNISTSDICDTMWTRGGGWSQKPRRHGGYRPQDGCWSQQRRRVAEDAGRGRPSRNGSSGCHRGRLLKLQMRNPVFWCIFSPVPCDLRPWMEAMRSLRLAETERITWKKLGPVAD